MEFRPRHRCNRWYIPVFWSLMSMSIINSWHIYKNLQKEAGISLEKRKSQKEFVKVINLLLFNLQELAKILIGDFKDPKIIQKMEKQKQKQTKLQINNGIHWINSIKFPYRRCKVKITY